MSIDPIVDPAPPRYRRRADASAYLRTRWGLRCASATLAKLAVKGGGPLFVHAGRFPLYPEAELDEWARSRISPLKRSTSDDGCANRAIDEPPPAAPG